MGEDKKNITEEIKQTDNESLSAVDLRVIPPINTFENIDCMEMLKKCPDKHFDLAIVDPPYGIGLVKTEAGNWGIRNHSNCDTKMTWDFEKPTKEYIEELMRVSKNQIIFGANHFSEILPNSTCWLVWDKANGENYFADCELAWTSFKSAVRKIKVQWGGANSHREGKRIHPTQKPIALYRWILYKYAKKGDLILDTHVGSGSSIVACIEGGFNYYGCEIDKDYYEAARRRIERAFRKYELFENEAV